MAALHGAAAAAVNEVMFQATGCAGGGRAAQPGATPRNIAPQPPAPAIHKTNPRPPAPARAVKPLNPNQLTAARLLLAGHPVGGVAAALGVHRYTVSRWKGDPRFQAELRRQVAGATARHAAQHGATFSQPRRQNEPTGAGGATPP